MQCNADIILQWHVDMFTLVRCCYKPCCKVHPCRRKEHGNGGDEKGEEVWALLWPSWVVGDLVYEVGSTLTRGRVQGSGGTSNCVVLERRHHTCSEYCCGKRASCVDPCTQGEQEIYCDKQTSGIERLLWFVVG